MTENKIGFLYKAAASLQRSENNNSITLLRSYYLMRCKEMTKGYGLPDKHFSSKVRCSRCSIEWRKGTQTKVKSINLSKKQKQRIRALKSNKDNKEIVRSKRELLHSNEIVQICTFCKQSTVTSVLKPDKVKKVPEKGTDTKPKKTGTGPIPAKAAITNVKKHKFRTHTEIKNKVPEQKKNEINVYSNSMEVFSINNKKNTLVTAHKEKAKVIKNNKKKKDKFAGLCQTAVLATAKLKQEKDKQNKLNLFLKPSS